MFFASLFCLKNDRSTSSSNIIAQWSRHACLDIKSREFMLSSLKEFVLVAWKDWDRGRNLTSNFPLEVAFTELYYISGDCALIPRQSTNCNQKHGGFWPNLRHFDVTVSLFSCRTPLTRYLSGKNYKHEPWSVDGAMKIGKL